MINIVSSIYENLILFTYLFHDKDKKQHGFPALLINIILLSLMNIIDISTYIKVPVYLAITTLLYSKIIDEKIGTLLFKELIYLMLLAACDVFTLSLFEVVSQTDVEIQMQLHTEIVWILVGFSKLLCFIILSVFSRRFQFHKRKIYIAVYVPLFSNLMMVFILGNEILIMGEGHRSILTMGITIVTFLSSFVSLFLTDQYLERRDIESETQLSLLQMESQYKYYKAKKEELNNLQSIRHDLKNHLLILESESSERQTKYLESLISRIDSYHIKYNTGNETIDVILMEKVKVAENQGIDISILLEAKELNSIEAIDNVIIFGNLLDNAIEACQREQVYRKYIRLSGKAVENFYVLVCKNSYDINSLKENAGHFSTSKINNKHHGFGLRNVERTVKKYNGELVITNDETEFCIKIIFPLANLAK